MPISREFGPHGLVGLPGMLGRAVDQMQQGAAALDMTKKTIAQANALVGAFDQTWNVRQHELALIDAHHTELRIERRERIIRDLRLGSAHRRQERRLACVWQTDETGIRDQLQAQPDRALLAGLTGVGVARRSIGGTLEVRIAKTTIAALGDQHALPDRGEIGQQGLVVLVKDLRAGRYLEHDVGTARAGAIAAHAMATRLGLEVLLVAIVDQRVQAVDAQRNHVTATPSIAAVRTAEFNELLAPKRHTAVSARAGADVDLGLIEELHGARGQLWKSMSFK